MMDIRHIDIRVTVAVNVGNRCIHAFIGIPPELSNEISLNFMKFLAATVQVKLVRSEVVGQVEVGPSGKDSSWVGSGWGGA